MRRTGGRQGGVLWFLTPPGWSPAVCRQRWPWEMCRKKRRFGTWRWSEKTSSPSAGQFIFKNRLRVCRRCLCSDSSRDFNRLNTASVLSGHVDMCLLSNKKETPMLLFWPQRMNANKTYWHARLRHPHNKSLLWTLQACVSLYVH